MVLTSNGITLRKLGSPSQVATETSFNFSNSKGLTNKNEAYPANDEI